MSASTQNQAFKALFFLYREVLGIEFSDFRNTIRAKQSKRISVVLTKEEIKELFGHLSGIHALMLKLIYASGIRLTECVLLRTKDLDCDNQTLIIRSEKGDKDRTTLFPELLHSPLKAALKNEYCQSGRRPHPSHSLAIQLLQDGYDVRNVQNLLGHKDLNSTIIYTHLLKRGAQRSLKSGRIFKRLNTHRLQSGGFKLAD